jgi:hypothetical protein
MMSDHTADWKAQHVPASREYRAAHPETSRKTPKTKPV